MTADTPNSPRSRGTSGTADAPGTGAAGTGAAGTGAAGTAGAGVQTPVAIVGMGAFFPGARDLAAYWRNIVGGVDAISEVPADRWGAEFYEPDGGADADARRADRVYCRRGGFCDQDTEFDLARLGIMPKSIPGTEPDQLIALQVAHDSLLDAGGDILPEDRQRVGVILGRGGYLTPGLVRLDQRVRTANQLVSTLRELLPDVDEGRLETVRTAFHDRLGPEQPESAIGLVPNLAASRLANRLDLRGPAYTVDAACASSLVAVDHAVRELSSGRCDVMLAGGVHHCHDITLWSVFSQLGALSPSQRISPLSADADGVLIGEGTGIVVLKRLADAERDGDRVYAVISGTGVASDGRSASLLNPDPGGQVRAVTQAWEAAGLDPAAPDSIGLLEAHGTATPAGDRAELTTLATVFGPAAPQDGTGEEAVRPAIGSVKSQIGHAMPAAGVAGLIKAALAVHHETLPPTLHCEQPHEALGSTRFAPLAEARPWTAPASGAPRRAGVNAFGFGGINAHVVLEQPARAAAAAPPAAAPSADRSAPAVVVSEPEPVLRLAAPTTEALAELLDADDATVLARGLATRQTGDGLPVRLGIVAPDARRLKLARRAVAKGKPWRGRTDVWFSPQPLLGKLGGGRTAFVFPGLEAEFEPQVAELAAHFGLPWTLDADSSVGDVGRHGKAVFQLGRLLDAALRRIGVVPDAVAGHSVGEWTAMAAGGIHAADEVDAFLEAFEPDALNVPGVAFGVLGMPAERVLEELAGREDVVLSHDNAPNQAMVCGPEEAVQELVLRMRAQGVISQVLPFRSGFHTPMLAPYLDPIRAAADTYTLNPQQTPVWSATLAAPYPREADAVRELFVRHLLEPVRFRLMIEAMHRDGFRAFLTLGAGQIGSLIDDTLAGHDRLVVPAHVGARDSLAQLRRVATALWVDGGSPDVTPLPALAGDRTARAGATVPAAATTTTTAGTRAASTHGVRPTVRLDLGGPLVSLPPQSRGVLGERRSRPAVGATGGGSGESGALAELADRADRFPLAGELAALLEDTASVAGELIEAGRARSAGQPVRAVPAPARQPVHPGEPGQPVQRSARQPAQPAQPPRPGAAGGSPAATHPTELRVDVDRMPYLLDHCFFRQRPGWPDEGDRWPIVPATTVITHLMRFAEQAAPGTRAVAVHDVRLLQWIEAIPSRTLPVTVERTAADRMVVGLTGYSQATVELAPTAAGFEHSDGEQAPAPWQFAPESEHVPQFTAERLYSERWMFHGPLFQGVERLTAIGERHVRGDLVSLSTPGALLDNVGQLLGFWIMDTLTERTTVFPAGMRRIRFHGPQPAPGERLECLIRITDLTDNSLTADMQLVHRGRVWAEFDGWTDRRFDTDPGIRAVDRFPGHHTLSQIEPEGWTAVHERWPDLATRGLIMRNVCGSAERAAYEELAPTRRRRWLLGRIAAKDAVRELLWREAAEAGRGSGESDREEIYPAEVALANDATGRPYASGVHGRKLGELTVSIAHCGETGVAIASRGPVGIDLEEVVERPRATRELACTEAELVLLDALVAAGADGEALWFTRFWAAKEAVAKARGTGLGGRPQDFEVRAHDAGTGVLTVLAGGASHHVRTRELRNPPGLPDRGYVVAWTSADGSLAAPPHAPTPNRSTTGDAR
ncbi:polyketide synthase dehydratase domain-containing protein [Streptomyces sp. P38-E01]|uniref:Polyketide synthase dehydratase domain-containing protein n=1 Tax=Streptomyces tardus TaxID=2780544 RepID=A0A949N801_9ACTN|nr:type I polyketide synthase [Streptomyces tardus]MBU7598011.1 polyketide synthase dehydratase domain-containing protein [Streptomyces tardus]